MRNITRVMAGTAALLMLLSAAGCGESATGEASSPPPDLTTPAAAPEIEPSPQEPEPHATAAWESEIYEDAYLRYEIPANWALDAAYSNEAQRLSFFTPVDAATDRPSNVNLQILSLENRSQEMAYDDPAVQEDFHAFLLSEGGLPAEAADGTFTATKVGDIYVYALAFERAPGDGVAVHQTAYFPMGLPYTIAVWATDWNDGCTPDVDELALHICATLEIL